MSWFKRNTAGLTPDRVPDDKLSGVYARVRTGVARERKTNLRIIQAMGVNTVVLYGAIGAAAYGLVTVLPAVRMVPVPFEMRSDGTPKAYPVMELISPEKQDTAQRATLWQYVAWRESWSDATAKARYDTVVELSDYPIGRQFADWYNSAKPDGPQVAYKHAGININIEQDNGADYVNGDPYLYRVPYWRTVITPGMPKQHTHWTAFVRFHHVAAVPLLEAIGFNPTALKVSEYWTMQDDAPPTPQQPAARATP